MSDGGKGSAPRPFSVDQKTFGENWDAIFNNGGRRSSVIVPSGGADGSTTRHSNGEEGSAKPQSSEHGFGDDVCKPVG